MTILLRALAVVAALLAAAPAFAQAFPVTIKHALGETTIPAEPKRIVTLGWSSTDAAIALGTVPVGMPTFRSEGWDSDYTPWIEEAVTAMGAPLPRPSTMPAARPSKRSRRCSRT